MSDVFIASEQTGRPSQPFLCSYGGNLYQLVPVTAGTPITMYQSTNGGASWASLATLTGKTVYVPGGIFGTRLFFWYLNGSFAVELGYFDFTTGAFVTITTSGNPTFAELEEGPLIAVLDNTHQFVATEAPSGVLGSVGVGEYVSGAFTAIGTIARSTGGYADGSPEGMIVGASGILHLLYTASASGAVGSSCDLGYANVVSGTLSSTTMGNVIAVSGYSNGWEPANNPNAVPGMGPLIQIGATIYGSYYNPTTQKLMLLSFGDVVNPTFTTTVIDPSWSVSGSAPTGLSISAIALIGSTLYCFYTNGKAGDGWLYMSTSTNSGATWSARQQLFQHLVSGNPYAIYVPEVGQFLSGSPSGTFPVSYRDTATVSPLVSRYFYGVTLVTESARNYVLS